MTAWVVARPDLPFGGGEVTRLVHPLLPEVTSGLLTGDGLRLLPGAVAPEPLPRGRPEAVGPFLVRLLGLASFLKWRGLGISPRGLALVGSMPGDPERPWLGEPPVPEWRAASPALAAAVVALRLAGRRVDAAAATVAALREAVARAVEAGGVHELAALAWQADLHRRRPELLLHEIARLAGVGRGVADDLLGLAYPMPSHDGAEPAVAAGASGLLLARGLARRRPGEGSFVEIGPASRLHEGAVLRHLADRLDGDPRAVEIGRRAAGEAARALAPGPPLTLVGRDVALWDPRSRAAWGASASWRGVARVEVRPDAPAPWESGDRVLGAPAGAAEAAALVWLPFASLIEAVSAWEEMSREARGDVAALVAAARRFAAAFEPGGTAVARRRVPRALRAASDRARTLLAIPARRFPVAEAAAVTGLPGPAAESLLRRAVADGEIEEADGLFTFREPRVRARRAAVLSRAERRDAVERLEGLGLATGRTVPARLARGTAEDRAAACGLFAELGTRGAWAEAVDLLDRAADGDWLDAPLLALQLLLRAGDMERARSAASGLRPDELAALPGERRREILRGLARAGDPALALSLVNGDDPASRLLAARLLLDVHRDDEAGAVLGGEGLRGALPEALAVERALLVADREGRRSRYAAAARALARAGRLLGGLSPSAATGAATTAGCLAADLGRFEEALGFFRLAKESAPDDARRADALFDMAGALRHADRMADAEKALGEALGLYAAAGEQDRYVSALGNRADIALASGDVAGARRDLERVLAHDRARGREWQLLFALPSWQVLALLDADLPLAAQTFVEAEAASARFPDHPAARELMLHETRRLLAGREPAAAAGLLERARILPDNRMQNETLRLRLAASAAVDAGGPPPEGVDDLPDDERRLLDAERVLAAGRSPGALTLRILERRASSPGEAPEVVLRLLEWAGRFPGLPRDLRELGERTARGLGLGRAAAHLAARPEALAPAPPVDPTPGHVAEDPSTVEAFRLVSRVARSRVPVLIRGETGTGKEIVAQELHRLSGRGPIQARNVASLSPTLAEAELFGHVRGAFTGADRDRVGWIESASGGTLFLDEVGDLPLPLQPKLLRVLQERELSRVGELKVRRVDLRLVSATHRDLEAMVEAGTFRADLYQRLKGIEVTLAPLRERPRDLEALIGRHLGPATLAPEARRLLRAYPWPGNVRELLAALESARALASPGTRIEVEHLPPAVRARAAAGATGAAAAEPPTHRAAMRAAERAILLDALAACGGNRTHAARRLGLARQTLVAKLKALGVK